MDILQIQAELLRREYPHLLPNEDPDIERYFFLRNSGRSREALNLYQLKLKPRYPNDEFRTMLLRLYRNRDPAYRELQARAYRTLGARSLEKMKRLIVFVADRADSYNPQDAYSTIRAAELIKQVLPRERYEAISTIERLFHYSQTLNLRTQSLYRAAELIRAYLNDALTVIDEERRRREDVRKRAVEERRRRFSDLDVSAYGWDNKPAPFSDLMDAVVFSPADLAHIEIPQTITKPEDKTLVYCTKYWNRIEDQSFERLLFLYSRKFGVKNYDVFKAIQRGRLNNKRDDEILASVMSCIITGYYYSVMGDRYVQQQWTAIKARLLPPATQPSAPAAAAPKPVVTPKPAAQPAAPAPAAAAPKPVATPKSAAQPAAPAPKPAISDGKTRHSVSQRLQELSGRSYDVFQDRFLAHVRPAIRKVLGTNRGIFFNLPLQAEDIVFNFLKTHYNDPYMNWEDSDDRIRLAKMGFNLDSVIPVIDECYGMF
ncbi:MAG: hypothetical protein LBP80_03630 [Treponema sp.]|jgi:hypothetical protein|nr:hypothetical protein [Treponema sp.]